MNQCTKLVLEGIELRKKYPDQAAEIEDKMSRLIDAMGINELVDLGIELERRGIVNFGYPQKTITPSPTLDAAEKFWSFFKRK